MFMKFYEIVCYERWKLCIIYVQDNANYVQAKDKMRRSYCDIIWAGANLAAWCQTVLSGVPSIYGINSKIVNIYSVVIHKCLDVDLDCVSIFYKIGLFIFQELIHQS